MLTDRRPHCYCLSNASSEGLLAMSVVKAYGRVCAVVCASCDGRPTFATCSRRYQCCQSLKQPVNVRTPEQCSRHIVARTNGKDRERASHWVSFPSSAMKCVLTSSAFRVLRPIRKLSRRYLLPSSAIQNSRRLRTRLCSHISVARVTALCLMQLRMLHLSVAVQLVVSTTLSPGCNLSQNSLTGYCAVPEQWGLHS